MKSKKEKIRGIAILISIIVVGISATIYDRYFKSLPQDYTIGKVVNIWKPLKGGTNAGYNYLVNGKKYEGNISNFGYEEVARPGKRFIVEYPEANVSRGVMHLNIPVPDSIIAPEEGWDELPEFAR